MYIIHLIHIHIYSIFYIGKNVNYIYIFKYKKTMKMTLTLV